MDWDFRNAEELLRLCADNDMPISEVMINRELQLGETRREAIIKQIDGCLRVMNVAANRAISDPQTSMGGFLGGEAFKLSKLDDDKTACGTALHNALVYALAIAETNASMGVIVAAPTAGSAGVVPAVLLSIYEYRNIDIETLRHGLINASAIGYLMTRNASVAGAEAGCQAEVGSVG